MKNCRVSVSRGKLPRKRNPRIDSGVHLAKRMRGVERDVTSAIHSSGKHGIKVQPNREIEPFVRKVFALVFSGIHIDIEAQTYHTRRYQAAFKILRVEGNRLVCYVNPPGIDQAIYVAVRVTGYDVAEVEKRFIETIMPNREIPLSMCNKVLETGDRMAFWSDLLNDDILDRLMIRLFARQNIDPDAAYDKSPGQLFRSVTSEESVAALCDLLEELNPDGNGGLSTILSIDSITALNDFLRTQRWMYYIRSHRHGQGREGSRLSCHPDNRALFAVYRHWGVVPSDTAYDEAAFLAADKDQFELFRTRSADAKKLAIVDEMRKKLHERKDLLEAQLLKVEKDLQEANEIFDQLSKDCKVVPEVAREIVRDHFKRKPSLARMAG